MSQSASANEITKIEKANLVCSQPGGTIVLSAELKKLWQGEKPSDKTGLEFTVIKFMTARCPNCYTVEAKLDAMEKGQYFIYGFSSDGFSFKKAKVKITAVDTDENGKVTKTLVGQMKCKVK